jgi:PhnB protein
MEKIKMEIGIQVYAKGSGEAVEFYKKAFGAELGYHVLNPDGGYFHAELTINGKPFLAVSEIGEDFNTEVVPKYPNMNFGVILDNTEAVRQAYSILSDGAATKTALRALPWSDLCADVVDRFGVYWYLSVPQHRPAE